MYMCCSMYHLREDKVIIVEEDDGDTVVKIIEVPSNPSKQRYAEFTPTR